MSTEAEIRFKTFKKQERAEKKRDAAGHRPGIFENLGLLAKSNPSRLARYSALLQMRPESLTELHRDACSRLERLDVNNPRQQAQIRRLEADIELYRHVARERSIPLLLAEPLRPVERASPTQVADPIAKDEEAIAAPTTECDLGSAAAPPVSAVSAELIKTEVELTSEQPPSEHTAEIGPRAAGNDSVVTKDFGIDNEKVDRAKIRSDWIIERLAGRPYKYITDHTDGPSDNTLRRYRSGETSNQDHSVRGQLAKVFGCDIAEVPR